MPPSLYLRRWGMVKQSAQAFAPSRKARVINSGLMLPIGRFRGFYLFRRRGNKIRPDCVLETRLVLLPLEMSPPPICRKIIGDWLVSNNGLISYTSNGGRGSEFPFLFFVFSSASDDADGRTLNIYSGRGRLIAHALGICIYSSERYG